VSLARTIPNEMQVPFYRPSIGEAEINEVVATLRSGWLTTGPRTKQFETEFGQYIGQPHAVAVNSCTAALHLALDALDIKAGDVVVVPTLTFAATAEVVRYFNARPLLVDCRPCDLNMDVADAGRRIEAALASGETVKTIIPVHYGGQIGDVAGVKELSSKFKLSVVEDAAHCCPASYRADENSPWRMVGSEADITCFSFYANKTITTGEGGMACTPNQEYADRMRIMSLHGISRDAWSRFTAAGSWYYEIIAPGFKYNLTDIAAALGIHQLRRADELHSVRQELAEYYRQQFQHLDALELPAVMPNRIHSWHLFPIRLRLERLRISRDEFIRELKARGIVTSVHWLPLHMHPYYRETYGYKAEDLPVAASLWRELVTLPLFPGMTAQEREYVAHSVAQVLSAHQV
jgi:dTDP-4-amino-4,6-dideoxygalactose transaminase